MPQLTWAQQTLCTIADVRKRLNNPNIVFATEDYDDTPVGFTVDTSTDVITTGVQHNFTINNIARFANSGGALPAPLAANTDYWVIAVPSATTLKVSTVKGGTSVDIATAGTGTNTIINYTLDKKIQEKIDLSKDWVRQDLSNYFQQKIPGRIKDFLAFKRSQVDSSQSEFSRNLELADRGLGSWAYPTYGFFTFDGLFIDISGYAVYGQKPLLRFNYGAPTNGTSGTFAGLAINGDVLADMKNRNLYINREVDDPPLSPVWDLFQPEDALNYILNISELVHVGTSAAILAMAKDGMFRNRVNNESPVVVNYMDFTIAMWTKTYNEDKTRGLSLVNIDISGSGLMDDWKRGFTRAEVVVLG